MVTAAEGYLVFGICIGLYIGVMLGMYVAERAVKKTFQQFNHWRSEWRKP